MSSLSSLAGPLPRPAGAGGGEPARLPEPGRLLAWVYLARLALALAIFLAAALAWRDAPPGTTLAASLCLVLAGVVTALGVWYTHLLRRAPGRNFLYGQVLFDVLLVTTVVHLTGGSESTFAPLYVLVICAAAVLLPLPGGVLVGLLASILYLADVVWSAETVLDAGVGLQVLLFTSVALVTGYLGDRLRRTGAELGAVESELRLLRLDTNEILDSIHTGILSVDGAGRLMFMNPAAVELLGLPPEEWLGRPVLPTLDRLAPGLGRVIARSIETRKPIRRSETDEDASSPFVLGVSTTLMEHSGDGPPPVTVSFQDITEKKRVEALRRRSERLEAVAELSASLAHEIKNPLASIRSAVEQLVHDDVDQADSEILGRLVMRESDRLSRLLAEFLDFARVKVIDPQPLDFAALVQEVMLLVRAHPDAADRALRIRSDAHGELRVRGAPDLLHRAVLNLALNAVQWAGPGGWVEVGLGAVSSDLLSPDHGAAPVVRLTVSDSGPGVPPEAAEHIFDPFFTRRPGGTGLGLALVQRAAEAHGGAVFVENGRPGSGARFTFYLPLAAVAPAAAAGARGARQGAMP